MKVIRSLCGFSKKKEIIVNNFFTNAEIGKYSSLNDGELQALVQEGSACKKLWLELQLEEREKRMLDFHNHLQTDHAQRMAQLLSQCTGKEMQECISEVRISFKILKNHFRQLFGQPTRIYSPPGQKLDYYDLEPFDHLLAVFDHRHPILSAVKYLGLSLYSGSYLLLRPSHTVLPAISLFKQAWDTVSNQPTFTVIADSSLDPKKDDSPIPKLLTLTDGFLSFDGRMKDGFDFYYFMVQQSPTLRQSEFLLTSSDSAYIMANLSADQLQRAAKIVARGCFSNCGHNFNSIKRVFVDREVGEAFLQLLVAETKQYAIGPIENYAQVNNSLLAPFLLKEELTEGVKQLKALREQHSDEMKHILGGEEAVVKIGEREVHFITPAIFQVTADFPNYNYQNEEFMLPICFVNFVESSSDCIQRINSSIFGTATSIFTGSATLQGVQPMGKKLDVGTVNVNTWEVTDNICYSGRKRSGKGFSFSPLSNHNILKTRAVSRTSQ